MYKLPKNIAEFLNTPMVCVIYEIKMEERSKTRLSIKGLASYQVTTKLFQICGHMTYFNTRHKYFLIFLSRFVDTGREAGVQRERCIIHNKEAYHW